MDLDGDGYASTAQIGVDIDLSPSTASAVVYLKIFGRELSLPGNVVIQTQQFPVVGDDNLYEQFRLDDLPHGHWDFRIEVYLYDGTLVASSAYGQFPAVMGVAMETASEDAIFTAYGAFADSALDANGNGYRCMTLLSWALIANVGTHSVWSDLYISDGTTEWPLPTTDPYLVTDTGHGWIYMMIAGRPHGHYRIRMVLWEVGTNQFLREFHYGELPNWTNIPLETGREDKGPSQVFDPNPVNKLNNPCLWDHHDSAAAVPPGAYIVVDLDSLNPPPFDDEFYRLSGAYVNITDISPPVVPPPWMPGPSFAYTRNEHGFEATMAYYHITRNQEYIQTLGMGFPVCQRQINVDVFGTTDRGALAQYMGSPPGAGYIVAGLGGSGGDPGVDAAEDADVLLHEYGHAILDNIAPGTFRRFGDNPQPLWMNEGFAYYWGASSTYDASLAHGFPPEYFGEWSVKNYPGCLPAYQQYGNLDNRWTFDSIPCCPFDTTQEHRDGQLWEGALWDMLQSFGKTAADRIIIDGLFKAGGLTDFTMWQVVPLFLDADRELYGGAHVQQIINIFAARGINVSAPCDCPHQGDVNNDGFVDVSDVIQEVDIAFNGGADIQDPACPTTRGDVVFDTFVDVLDVVREVDIAFSGGIADNPCAP